jgi:RNA polymerase sigma factor (sigma-70 family)
LAGPSALAIEELDRALTLLEEVSPRRSQLLEQRYFGGLKLEECAEALDISLATVKRELRSARAWLARALFPEAAGASDVEPAP